LNSCTAAAASRIATSDPGRTEEMRDQKAVMAMVAIAIATALGLMSSMTAA
jgi:hypothetical protein